MTRRQAAPATFPPALPGLDPAWSRLVPFADAAGVQRTAHVLDTHAGRPTDDVVGTLLCVHGNPTWGYLWRRLLAEPPAGWRVVAPDQLGMGHSERLDVPRTLAGRVDDLGRLTAALGLDGPVVTVAHDWGGIVSSGWAVDHPGQLRAMVLTNTAVHQPPPGAGPLLIRAAHLPPVRETVCVATPVFVRATTALTRPLPDRAVRDAYAEPYRGAARRTAVGDFVADIPFAADHPSRPALDDIAGRLRGVDVPALLLWGPRDPVFGEDHLRDLQDRLPAARTHRYPHASHLLPEDAPEYVTAVGAFVAELDTAALPPAAVPGEDDAPQLWARLEARATDHSPAVVEVDGSTTSWAQLHRRVTTVAGGLVAAGVRRGDRVALLVPPGTDLTVAAYAVWRAGAAVVVADRGLGLRGMGRALRSARVDHAIGTPQGLIAARAMRLPGGRFGTRALPGGPPGLDQLAGGPQGRLPEVTGEDLAAVLFTSGSTGPAKGVLYRHRQARAQVALVRRVYALTDADRLVAAFAPFSLLGPALGIASTVPDVDVTTPGSLTAPLLADAVARLSGTVVFASPAALRRVSASTGQLTAGQRTALGGVRLLMSAGAPVPVPLLRELAGHLPAADLHTPYGMTEALPVTDVSLTELELAGTGNGVCVGRPVPGVEVSVLGPAGRAGAEPDTTGEICVRAGHVLDGYDALWMTSRAAARLPGWHRTGDVGHLDAAGRLWIEGRAVHVIDTPDGAVTPVGVEQRVETVPGVASAAVVGVGPPGTQQVVVVLAGPRGPLADPSTTAAVRAVAGVPVAAVLTRPDLPVDIRHASKIDRTAVARWADGVLAGHR